jgi:hypothetical protein
MNPFDHKELLATLEKLNAAPPAVRIQKWEDIPGPQALPEEQVEWVVEGMLPAGGVTLLAGESGSYKTWLALALARSVAAGQEFLGRRALRRGVLYLDRENPAALVRQRAERLGLGAAEGLKLWGGWLDDPPPAIGDARLAEMARQHGPLMVFDSFIRFHAQDENSATEMAAVMAELRGLANAGACVLVLHHKPKGESSQYRGSSDIRAGVDVAISVSLEREAGRLKLACFKNRLGPEFSLTLVPALDSSPAGFTLLDAPAKTGQFAEDVLRLQQLIRENPGLTQSGIVQKSGLPKNRIAQLLRRWEGMLWRTERGQHYRTLYYAPDAGQSSEWPQ